MDGGSVKKQSLIELQRQKAIERQKELDKYLKEVQDYFEYISEESEEENLERESYWIEQIEKGNELKDFTRDAYGREISFMGNYDIKPSKCDLQLTQAHIDEFTYCAYHPIYTIRNYFKIVSSDQGVIPFRLYDFQEEMVRQFFKYNRLLTLQSRQSGKTSSASALLLFYCIFNKNKNVGIIANKKATANEILDRIKLMYLNLPMWLKPGVVKWNEGRVEFANGCKLITSATTAASIRGQSIACVDGNTILTVRSDATGIEDITVSELAERLDKVNNEFVLPDPETFQTMITNTGDCKPEYEILTPNGFSKFGSLLISHMRKTIKLRDYNLICTPDHKIKINDVFVEAQTLPHDDYCDSQDVYDLTDVQKNNQYFTNGIISHNCLYIDEMSFIPRKMWDAFYKSTFPVISAAKLAKIVCTTTPNGKDHFYYMWQDALKKRSSFKAGRVVKWYDVPGRDEAWRISALSELGNNIEAFNQEYLCVSGNTMIDVFDKKEGVYKTIPIETIYDDLKVDHNDTFLKHSIEYNNRYLVRTPNGYEHFDGIHKNVNFKIVYEIEFTDNTKLTTSPNHILIDENDTQIKSENLTVNQRIKSADGLKTIRKITKIKRNRRTSDSYDPLYELINVGKNNTYYTENVLSHNCEFLSASVEYINLEKLERIEQSELIREPIFTDPQTKLHVFEQPQPNHDYIMCVDVSEGKGLDNQAFSVIDASQMPLKVVATLKNNKMDTIEYAKVIYGVALKYNEAYLVIENNFSDVAKDLWFNYEYTNIINFNLSKSEQRQGKYFEIGLKTTSKVRRIGEEYFKHLVENDKIILNDRRIIQELNNLDYNEAKKRFEPRDESINDDLWAGFKCFCYIAKTMFFENMLKTGSLKLYDLNKTESEAIDNNLSFIIKPVVIETTSEPEKKRRYVDLAEKKWQRWI